MTLNVVLTALTHGKFAGVVLTVDQLLTVLRIRIQTTVVVNLCLVLPVAGEVKFYAARAVIVYLLVMAVVLLITDNYAGRMHAEQDRMTVMIIATMFLLFQKILDSLAGRMHAEAEP